nr:tRNA (N6-threonylcarbamoyladenosine(37)-N6)-methyltransferase TrmO [Pseudidiomarina woesei]
MIIGSAQTTHQNSITMRPIGVIHSPYAQKFAVPRQPGLVRAARATIELQGAAAHSDSVRGLEQFSHLWVMFVFHQTQAQGWKPLVRPPRLGGNKKLGVFATRSTFRPNPIGLSVVELEAVRIDGEQVFIDVIGGDWVNQTPVLDIKPYIPYADAINNAQGGFAQSSPATLPTVFSAEATVQIEALTTKYPQLRLLIEQVLAQDPRPAYQNTSHDLDKTYGMTLYDVNIRWQVVNQQNHVISVVKGF